ncbi:HNH endonuclease signature motif containing protein [Ilumatobacter coccineus]|nr:HNH endonuclease signature motif containing protein [Ilumatobacter coccineus]
MAATIAVAEHRTLNAVDGHRSMSAYLRATCNWSKAQAARFRSAAHLVNTHSVVGDAWIHGRIGEIQVSTLSKLHRNRRVNERLGEAIDQLVVHAETLPLADFEVVAARFATLADQDGAFDTRPDVEQRSATVTDVAGCLHVRANGGDPLEAAEFIAIVERFVEAEFRHDQQVRHDMEEAVANGDVVFPPLRSRAQRTHDALLAMARAGAAHEGMINPAEPLVSVLVDQQTMAWIIAHSGLGASTSLSGESIDPFTGLARPSEFLDDLLGDVDTLLDRRCETDTGIMLKPADVLRAVMSGHMRRMVLDGDRVPVDLGRSRRVFAGPARAAAKLLVPWCEHPGCDLPAALCQVDHSVEWQLLGSTDQANAGLRCGFHNREKSRSKRRTRRDRRGLMHTSRPDGTIILPVGCRPPTFPSDDDPDDAGTSCDAEETRVMEEAARNRLRLVASER